MLPHVLCFTCFMLYAFTPLLRVTPFTPFYANQLDVPRIPGRPRSKIINGAGKETLRTVYVFYVYRFYLTAPVSLYLSLPYRTGVSSPLPAPVSLLPYAPVSLLRLYRTGVSFTPLPH